MPLDNRISEQDDREATKVAEVIGIETSANEESKSETSVSVPTFSNGFIRRFYDEMLEYADYDDDCDDDCDGDCDDDCEDCVDFDDSDEEDEDCCEHCAGEEGSYSLTAEEIEMFTCKGCRFDTFENDEYYMVQFSMWQTVVPTHLRDAMLCIGCLEGYLGRKLSTSDFTEAPVNYMGEKSDRLKDRLGEWFTGELFDPEQETLVQATQRLARQRGW